MCSALQQTPRCDLYEQPWRNVVFVVLLGSQSSPALADSPASCQTSHLIRMVIGAVAGLQAEERDYYTHKSRRFNGLSDFLWCVHMAVVL